MRRRKLLGALVGVALLGAVVFILWPRPDPITRENFDRIREGMSRAEVEAILGPLRDYRTGPTDPDQPDLGLVMGIFPLYWSWRGDAGIISIIFESGEVRRVRFTPARKLEQSPLANLQWRAQRLWRRWFA